ncbi:MAG: UDP-N-acetylglucosamine 4,6-dehydratase (inverting) [Acidobacteria bacterium]|nr:MAG: UDP-N-acetylglucosamine 4,6-dehydratase (inverting) [Acidobacteriota bacterium]
MSLDGKTILITGGTGSFGRAFISAVLTRHQPHAIRVLSRDELKQSELARQYHGDDRLRYLLGDIRDLPRLRQAFNGVDLVVHAAAMKQVPACEYNPFEAVKTNILGTENVIAAAIECDVETVVAISSDKAVSPVNLYGATKLCAEKLFSRSNAYVGAGRTRFASVRYGNVVGSRGSVVPLFQEQAAEGRLTITDPEMTRFWITLTQAVDLVIECATRVSGGEVVIPKIPSTKITDLAEAIAPGVPYEVTGIRPGEKLHEDLITPDESRNAIELDGQYVILPDDPSWQPASPWPEGKAVAPGFRYTSNTNDWWLTGDELKRVIAESGAGEY